MKSSCCLLALLWVTSVAATPTIDRSIYSSLANGNPVRVMVLFDLPEPVSHTAVDQRAERLAAVAKSTDEVLAYAGPGFQLTHRFQLLSAMAGYLDRPALDRLAAHPRVRSISVDGGGKLSISSPPLGLEAAQDMAAEHWDIDSSDIKVVVMDSGIDAGHADFAGALVAEGCFCANPKGNCCPNGQPTQFGPGSAADDHGHGTWVSSNILGRGNVARPGTVPGASLVSIKVLDAKNSLVGSADITAAFDWIAVNHPDANVVNVSLGSMTTSAIECDGLELAWVRAMRDAVQAVTANDTLIIASSGNQGDANGMEVPSCLSDVVSVGATWREDAVGSFFSYCPAPQVDPRRDDVACFSNSSAHLDILAPGVMMDAAALGGGTISGISGTSFAAPVVAGCAALIRAARPDLPWTEVRRLITASPVMVTDARTGRTSPRLDCGHTMESLMTELKFASRD
ncbi:MAG: S8 family peptidase [Wenzhouxiangella sp.]